MSKNKTPIPKHFASIEDVQEFWDTHLNNILKAVNSSQNGY
jgi:hypothetical protein